jgi:hypothetical protein
MDKEIHQDCGGRFVLDEIENAVDSLSVAAEFARRADPMKWKWVVIATHHALYSFCVAALAIRSLTEVLAPKRKRDELSRNELANLIRWAQSDGKIELSAREKRFLRPDNIVDFNMALKRIQDGEFCTAQMFGAKPVTISDAELRNLTWLNDEARNALVHFMPSQLILEIQTLREACLDALRTIESLVFDSNMLFDERKSWKPRVETTLQEFRENLTPN